MSRHSNPKPIATAFGVFWNTSFGPVPCEAYTVDAEGDTTSDDYATAKELAGAYERGETFLTYEGFVWQEAANHRAIECGNRYSVRELPAGTLFYDGEQLYVVAAAEPDSSTGLETHVAGANALANELEG